MKKRILFVDDEPNMLLSLRRMLHSMRSEWRMDFAESGPAALELLEQAPYDVVVTDMRMPEMDGSELLVKVKERYPHAVRIILSGHSDQEKILRSVRTAHRYLSKPADEAFLKETINRACALRSLLAKESLQGAVANLDALPSLPSLYAEIVEALNSPDCSLQEIGRIISKDPGMAAKVLHLVNSAFFALPRRISNPAQALSLLGIDTVKALVLTVQIFSSFDLHKLPGLDIDQLYHHSFITGEMVKRAVTMESDDKGLIDDAYMAGLLHDIGKLILADNYPEQYGEVLELERCGHAETAEAERQILGADHAEVGAYLLGLWGLPDPIIEAVAYHHQPEKCPAPAFLPLAAVHIADALQYDPLQTGNKNPEDPIRIDTDFLAGSEMKNRLDAWREIYTQLQIGDGADE